MNELAKRVILMSSKERCELLSELYVSQDSKLAPVCDILKTGGDTCDQTDGWWKMQCYYNILKYRIIIPFISIYV